MGYKETIHVYYENNMKYMNIFCKMQFLYVKDDGIHNYIQTLNGNGVSQDIILKFI
jgi:hypothetical protein